MRFIFICLKKTRILLLFLSICSAESCLLKDDANSIASVVNANIKKANIAKAVETNFKTLKTRADTKGAHCLYLLLGALLMTGEKEAIEFHDRILESGYRGDSKTLKKLVGLTWSNSRLHDHDEHIISARFKAGNLITQSLGINNFAAQQIPWQRHQACLLESLSYEEKSNITTRNLGQYHLQCSYP